MPPDDLYVFIDESGNFDFSPTGSTFFVLNAVATPNPVQGAAELLKWRHHILECSPAKLRVARPRTCTHFHCTEDAQYTRDGVFKVISGLEFRAYSVIVEKRKTNPAIQVHDDFYDRVFGGLIRGIVARLGKNMPKRLQIFASRFQLRRKETAFIGGLKTALSHVVGLSYDIHFHPAHSHHMLQVSDYVCWAIARKYERGDLRSYAIIKDKMAMEFDLFRKGTTLFY